MQSLPSVRLAANLNALAAAAQSVEQAERGVRGLDVAHHVLDPDGVLGLDPLRATDLDDALPALVAAAGDRWFLCLPVPGALAPLRGPAGLNQAALQHGEAVVASQGGPALVPLRVGQAVQWRVWAAERPQPPPSPYDADRSLREAVLDAARVLARLDVAAGARPAEPDAPLAPGYPARQRATAQRAAALLAACDAALRDDGGSITTFEAERRSRELRRVRAAAAEALVAAVSWLP